MIKAIKHTVAAFAALVLNTGLASAQAKLPYVQNFDDISDFESFVVADENNDQDTWRYDDLVQAARCERNYDADDWLITPVFELDGGKTYQLTFKAYVEVSDEESLEVYMGNGRRVSSLTTNIMPVTGISATNPQTYSVIFVVDESDDYRIGFHHCTVGDPYSNYLYIDDITLAETTSLSAPAQVGDFVVTPGAKGALSATVSMTAPVSDVSGGQLDNLTKVELYRDDKLINTFDSPAIGAALTYVDDSGLSTGMHTYKATAYNGQGGGDPAQVSAYIGVDVPGPVQNLHFEYDYDTHHATITWDAPEVGVNGGYIDQSTLRYSLRKYPLTADKTITDPIAATRFEDDVDIEWLDSVAEVRYKELEEKYHYPVARTIVVDGQGLMYYYVKPISDMGEGEEATSEKRIIGEPYTLPFAESFPAGYSTHFWYKPVTPGRTRWYELSDSRFAQDGDDGFIAMTTSITDEDATDVEETTMVQSGRLCLTGTTSPVMTLYYLYAYAMTNPIKVKVSTDGQVFTTVALLDTSNESLADKYIRAVVPLDAIAGADDCYVALEATLTNSVELIYVDNIAIYDQRDNDLTASIARLPAFLRSGEPRKVAVAVSNLGRNDVPAGSYTVNVYADGQIVGSAEGPAVATGTIAQTEVTAVAPATLPAEASIYAYVDYAADENLDNNQSTPQVIGVRFPSYPVPQDLTLAQDGGRAALQWVAPEAPRAEDEPVTDGFEDYEDFTITDLGPWTLVDGDRTLTYSWGEEYEWPNRTLPHAYIVLNPSEVVLASGGKGLSQIWQAHSGDKMLMSASFMADDWLISPELPGTPQTISFYARGTNSFTETFDVRYSTTDTETSSFVMIGNEVTVNGAAWMKYEYELPEGAVFFAIHRTSDDGEFLFVDDVTFVPEDHARQDIKLIGYNVYRDGRLLNASPVSATSYTDTPVVDFATYTVTAVYDKGESTVSNKVSMTSGIQILSVKPAKSHDGRMYDLMGRPATGKLKGVYIKDGRKIAVR